jgi:AcrR family transcriptional regulator
MPVEKLTPERRRQRTRETLLDAAEEIFVRRGVPGASMEEIAAEAGFSRAAIYAHFGSKDELLLAVMDRFITRQIEQLGQLVGGHDPVAAAVDAAEVFRKSASPELVPLELELRMNALRHPGLRQRLVEADRRASEDTTLLVESMTDGKGDLRIPARDLADLGRAAVIGLLLYAAVDEELRERYESLVETLFVLMTDTLVPTKPSSSNKKKDKSSTVR